MSTAQSIRTLEEDPARCLEASSLPFRPICLCDKPCFDRAMRELDDPICDCSFAVQYIWRGKYHTEIYCADGAVLTRFGCDGDHMYGFPAGGDLKQAVETLSAHCRSANEPLKLGLLSERMKARLEEALPGQFRFEEKRDSADYLYDARKMIDLPGPKLHSKRNFINRFRAAYEGRWSFEPFDPEKLDEIYEYEAQWCRDNRTNEGDLMAESQAIVNLLENGRALAVKGGILRLDGKVIGFSLGTFITPDVFCVHIEKADWMIPGAYQVLTNEVARAYCSGIRWVNREDDMGIEGLRKAKLSYQPEEIAMKYVATRV